MAKAGNPERVSDRSPSEIGCNRWLLIHRIRYTTVTGPRRRTGTIRRRRDVEDVHGGYHHDARQNSEDHLIVRKRGPP
jgi:hypothetical protein